MYSFASSKSSRSRYSWPADHEGSGDLQLLRDIGLAWPGVVRTHNRLTLMTLPIIADYGCHSMAHTLTVLCRFSFTELA